MDMKKGEYSDFFSKDKYGLIVLDMDGTLYYQRSMQILMCLEMGAFAIMHPFSLWKLKIISVFRKVREMEEYSCIDGGKTVIKTDLRKNAGLLDWQYAVTAKKVNRDTEEVRQVVEEWMFERPLKYLGFTCDKKLCAWVERWKKEGRKVVVFSDYPAKEKCKVLGIQPDAVYSSDENRIGEMKPSSKGLEVICQDLKMEPEQVLVIGDRMSKDGKMAEAAGVDFVIVGKWKVSRNRSY